MITKGGSLLLAAAVAELLGGFLRTECSPGSQSARSAFTGAADFDCCVARVAVPYPAAAAQAGLMQWAKTQTCPRAPTALPATNESRCVSCLESLSSYRFLKIRAASNASHDSLTSCSKRVNPSRFLSRVRLIPAFQNACRSERTRRVEVQFEDYSWCQRHAGACLLRGRHAPRAVRGIRTRPPPPGDSACKWPRSMPKSCL